MLKHRDGKVKTGMIIDNASAVKTFISKGAHFVIDDLRELNEVIGRINSLMSGSH